MDSTIYALVIPALIATIGLTRPEAGYLATAALVGAAVGGWGGGILADRIGRVKVLQITILWVALCTLRVAPSRTASTSCSSCAFCRASAMAARPPSAAC